MDGFLLVVRSRQTHHDAIQDSLAKLRRDRVVGVVLNDHQAEKGSYRARAYERYGMAYGRRAPGSAERRPSAEGDDVSDRQAGGGSPGARWSR